MVSKRNGNVCFAYFILFSYRCQKVVLKCLANSGLFLIKPIKACPSYLSYRFLGRDDVLKREKLAVSFLCRATSFKRWIPGLSVPLLENYWSLLYNIIYKEAFFIPWPDSYITCSAFAVAKRLLSRGNNAQGAEEYE